MGEIIEINGNNLFIAQIICSWFDD